MSVNDMWVTFKSDVIAAIERFIPTKMTNTKYSLPWHGSTARSDASSENARNFIFVLASQAALALRTITNGSEHMFKRSSEMHIGNIFPIYFLLRRKVLIPAALEKMKRQNSLVICKVPQKRRVWDQHT